MSEKTDEVGIEVEGSNNDVALEMVKILRSNIDSNIKALDSISADVGGSREFSLAKTKLEEGKMWLGKQMGNLGGVDLNAKRDIESLREVTEASE